MEKHLTIVPLSSERTVIDDEVFMYIKPPNEFRLKLHPYHEMDYLYPPEAILNDFEDDEDMDDDEFQELIVNENLLLGYRLVIPALKRLQRTYCLVLQVEDKFFPLATSTEKRYIELLRESIDYELVRIRVTHMMKEEKYESFIYNSIESLKRNLISDSNDRELNKQVVKEFKEGWMFESYSNEEWDEDALGNEEYNDETI